MYGRCLKVLDRMLQSMKAAGFCQQTRTVRVRGFYPSRVHVLRVATLASDGGAAYAGSCCGHCGAHETLVQRCSVCCCCCCWPHGGCQGRMHCVLHGSGSHSVRPAYLLAGLQHRPVRQYVLRSVALVSMQCTRCILHEWLHPSFSLT